MVLPLARWLSSASTIGILSTERANAATPVAMEGSAAFLGMAAPGLDHPETMARVAVGSTLEVNQHDGSQQRYALTYDPFFITGDQVPGLEGGHVIAGGYFDLYGRPIMDRSVPGQERQFFSDCPDGMSLLQPLVDVDKASLGISGNPVFAVVQFEYASRNLAGESEYGQLPSPIAVLTLDQDPTTGRLALVRYYNVPTKDAYGLWITCGASRSPWNTHLGSEEYPTDAFAAANDKRFKAFVARLYGDVNAATDPDKANPYLYNHVPEVMVMPDGTGHVKKHFCLGRISHELIQVCPDQRTVLMGDDYTNGGAFLFIADRAADLSSGSLYVAKWRQTSDIGPGSARLQWIKLGEASSDDIEHLAKMLKPTDIMDVTTSDPGDPSYTRIVYGGTTNWVRVKPGMDKAAAFLETHRYAALQGGSLGFTKWEGTTVNAADKVGYVAMSYIYKSMTDGSTDIHVEGPTAGAVYALNLRAGQHDSNGDTIDSEWVPVDMAAIPDLTGEDLLTPDPLGNMANPNKIANPDNIKFSERLRMLLIGEDSSMHVNNFLWAYDIDSHRLARVLSDPVAAESTGLQAVDDINGWTYIMSNLQHPGDWESTLHDRVKAAVEPFIDKYYKEGYGGSVGYVAGFPRISEV